MSHLAQDKHLPKPCGLTPSMWRRPGFAHGGSACATSGHGRPGPISPSATAGIR